MSPEFYNQRFWRGASIVNGAVPVRRRHWPRGATGLPSWIFLGLFSWLSLACSSTAVEAAPFDADRVIADATAQCAFGPRVPGTQAHRETKDWIVAELKALGLVVEEQRFIGELALIGQTAEAWNLWAAPADLAEEQVILLSAHWDTRPEADEEPPGRATTPFAGANDGAASVAFVLETVRSMQGTPLEKRLAVAFFDAEDSGIPGDPESWCKGAQFAAKNPPDWMAGVALGINIDMIAHSEVQLRKEGLSLRSAPEAMKRLWKVGRDLAPGTFLDEIRLPVIDDHVPFIEEGYSYIDLIGLPNPHWHRMSDVPENLDARSVAAVGGVLVEFLRQE